jgi:hypothetical protein
LEDSWLEKIRQPAQVEILLEAFARRSRSLPEVAHRVRDPKTLPGGLQQVVTDATSHVWVCFSDGARFWLFTGVVSLELSRDRRSPVLLVNSYSGQGALLDVGMWSVEHDGKWHLCD